VPLPEGWLPPVEWVPDMFGHLCVVDEPDLPDGLDADGVAVEDADVVVE
jgi:hypothetical protein